MPTWEEFKQKHVLNPSKSEHRNYESWNRLEQNRWLRNRLAAFGSHPGQQYGRKGLNSVIIAPSDEILNDFSNPGVKVSYNHYPNSSNLRLQELNLFSYCPSLKQNQMKTFTGAGVNIPSGCLAKAQMQKLMTTSIQLRN